MKTIQLTDLQFNLLLEALNVAQNSSMRQIMYNPKSTLLSPSESDYQQLIDALETGELEID